MNNDFAAVNYKIKNFSYNGTGGVDTVWKQIINTIH